MAKGGVLTVPARSGNVTFQIDANQELYVTIRGTNGLTVGAAIPTKNAKSVRQFLVDHIKPVFTWKGHTFENESAVLNHVITLGFGHERDNLIDAYDQWRRKA